VFQGFSATYRGWAWLDVDRWGNAGPKDGIYWYKSVGGPPEGEEAGGANEVYGWLPPSGGRSRSVFGHYVYLPDSGGPRGLTFPPHYPWLVAVDPRGALLAAGFGQHGVSRLRARRPGDPRPLEQDWQPFEAGRWVWTSGTPPDSPRIASRSSALKFGWGVHNYLGFADAWALRGDEPDEELLRMFEAPEAVRGDPTARQLWLDYVRANRSSGAEAPPAPPTPTSFYTLAPCRVLDTRGADTGGPALSAGTSRVFTISGNCGIPPTAKAVSFNVTVTETSDSGHLSLYPGGASTPPTSTINYRAGQTRANNAILRLGTTGTLGVFAR
jgi:hypothetical protein